LESALQTPSYRLPPPKKKKIETKERQGKGKKGKRRDEGRDGGICSKDSMGYTPIVNTPCPQKCAKLFSPERRR